MGQNGKTFQTSRRTLMTLGVATLAAPFVIRKSWAQSGRLVIRDSGGPFATAFETAFYKPFTEATGVQIVNVASTAEPTALVKSMVEAQSYTWDIAGGITTAAVKQLTSEGLLEEHEIGDDPNVKEILPEYMLPTGVGINVSATALGVRSDKFPAGSQPTSWADFWDVEKFPARRALRRNPIDTLEIALLASGIAPSDLYPLDLDRAFKQLDLIKPQIAAWWTSGAQANQMLTSGECDLVPTWTTRIVPAAEAGSPVDIMWNQNLWLVDYWAIPKGGPNVALCREFIKFASDAKRQAAYVPFVPAGPTNPNAYAHIESERAKILPTYSENREKGIMSNSDYWGENKDAVTERFNTWIVS